MFPFPIMAPGGHIYGQFGHQMVKSRTKIKKEGAGRDY